MTKRILFVDDEPMLLSGLQRSLRPMREEWEMVFVGSGPEALKLMEQQPFDIIVTDMRMPVMTGTELLEEVKQRFPQCFRIILSGQADQESILKAVDPTHQYLAKPCDSNELRKRLKWAFAVRGLLKNEELQAMVTKLQALPSLPSLYIEVTGELEKSEPSITRIAKLISQDMAMTAKMLQLVNSAFFGLRGQVSSPLQAVQLLGLDTLRALVLSTHVFDQFRTDILGEPETSYLWTHSLVAASFAKHIAGFEKANRRTIDDCFTAGLLHDSGKLILAFSMTSKYARVLELVRKQGCGLLEAEKEVLGCHHAEVAAYLLGSWGLPEAVVEGVAWHHDLSGSPQKGFSPAVAAHAASCLHEEQVPFWMCDRTAVDVEYLKQNGLGGHEESWRKIVAELGGSPATGGKSIKRDAPSADNQAREIPNAAERQFAGALPRSGDTR
jgi:HD-like signal output (HDOD) protein